MCPPFALRSIPGRLRKEKLCSEDVAKVVPYFFRFPKAPPHPHGTSPASVVSSEHLHLFAVFDGHGGTTVSQACAERLPGFLKAELDSLNLVALAPAVWGQAVSDALVRSFEALDACLPAEDRQDTIACGSTAVVALVGEADVWTAHVGDSRAVLWRGGEAVELTQDHSLERPDEVSRIKSAGGHVFWNGCDRVMGVLGMSRSFGDHDLRCYGVIATPEVRHLTRQPGSDDFLLLASDGVWHTLNNQEACQEVETCLLRVEQHGRSRRTAVVVAADVLARRAREKGSSDDITVVVVDINAAAEQLPPRLATLLQQRLAARAALGSARPPPPPQQQQQQQGALGRCSSASEPLLPSLPLLQGQFPGQLPAVPPSSHPGARCCQRGASFRMQVSPFATHPPPLQLEVQPAAAAAAGGFCPPAEAEQRNDRHGSPAPSDASGDSPFALPFPPFPAAPPPTAAAADDARLRDALQTGRLWGPTGTRRSAPLLLQGRSGGWPDPPTASPERVLSCSLQLTLSEAGLGGPVRRLRPRPLTGSVTD